MYDPILKFRRELSEVAEREWLRLNEAQRTEILLDYDQLAKTVGLDWAIFAEQWKRDRGG